MVKKLKKKIDSDPHLDEIGYPILTYMKSVPPSLQINNLTLSFYHLQPNIDINLGKYDEIWFFEYSAVLLCWFVFIFSVIDIIKIEK